MKLDDALTQISEIRQRLAATQVFRGYRAETAALSGVMALCAAWLQARLIPDPLMHVSSYLLLWISVAVISTIILLTEMFLRARRSSLPLQGQLNLLFIAQFSPCLIAGALLTLVIMKSCSEHAWMLPGLWAILFSMGIFASCRLLPRATCIAGGWYLAAGLACLARATGADAFSPWAMAATFGIGQFIIAFVLYWNLERGHAAEEESNPQ